MMGRVAITGTSFDIGKTLGRMARPSARRIASVVRRDSHFYPLCGTEMPALIERIRERFPHLWEELRGISAGMDLDMQEVVLWNCMQDRLDTAASSTIVINRLGYRLMLNKREMAPQFAGKGKVVEVHPNGRPGYLALYIPGCLPGATFAANWAGIAQIVDSVPEQHASNDGLPTFIISRAVLDASSLSEAIDIVMECERRESAHHVLASTQEFITVAITATPFGRTLAPIPNKHWHTNHFPDRNGSSECASSSMQRYDVLTSLMERLPAHPTEDDVLALLAPDSEAAQDALAIQPGEDGIGTGFLKLSPGRIEVRLYRAGDPVRHRRVMTVKPDQGQDARDSRCTIHG